MVSVDLWLRAKRVMVVFNDTPMEEGSGVFFLTLLTSLSLCSHTHHLSSHPSHRYP